MTAALCPDMQTIVVFPGSRFSAPWAVLCLPQREGLRDTFWSVGATGVPPAPRRTPTLSELRFPGAKEISPVLLPVWVQLILSIPAFCCSRSPATAIPPSHALEPKISPGASPSRRAPPGGARQRELRAGSAYSPL